QENGGRHVRQHPPSGSRRAHTQGQSSLPADTRALQVSIESVPCFFSRWKVTPLASRHLAIASPSFVLHDLQSQRRFEGDVVLVPVAVIDYQEARRPAQLTPARAWRDARLCPIAVGA